jgi:hypothetical protein
MVLVDGLGDPSGVPAEKQDSTRPDHRRGAGKRIRFAWSQASCLAREDNVAHDEQVVLRETM